MNPSSKTTSDPQDAKLARAIARDLELPLAAMRAAIKGLPGASPKLVSVLVEGLLNELDHLDHGIAGLVELSAPHKLRPTMCTVGEIIRAAQRALPNKRRKQVLVALEGSRERLMVDAIELERCLSSLLFDATGCSNEPVLLHGHINEFQLEITIVGGNTESDSFEEAVTLHELARLGAQVNKVQALKRTITISLPLMKASA